MEVNIDSAQRWSTWPNELDYWSAWVTQVTANLLIQVFRFCNLDSQRCVQTNTCQLTWLTTSLLSVEPQTDLRPACLQARTWKIRSTSSNLVGNAKKLNMFWTVPRKIRYLKEKKLSLSRLSKLGLELDTSDWQPHQNDKYHTFQIKAPPLGRPLSDREGQNSCSLQPRRQMICWYHTTTVATVLESRQQFFDILLETRLLEPKHHRIWLHHTMTEITVIECEPRRLHDSLTPYTIH